MNIRLITLADEEIKIIQLYVLDTSVRVLQLNSDGLTVNEYLFAKTDLRFMLNQYKSLGYLTEAQHMLRFL